MISPIVFSDLDDTLFQTARKMTELCDESRLASRALNGKHSYMTDPQAATVAWLDQTTRFIPVTARSTEALERCCLPFRFYRICSNGAVVLRPDGTPERDWQARMTSTAAAGHERMQKMLQFATCKTLKKRYRAWIVEEYGAPIYFCAKSNAEGEALDEIEDELRSLAGSGFTFHRNGNNLSFTPAGISKRNAVLYLLNERLDTAGAPIWGMGDSLTDLPFMADCHMMVIPRSSQIDEKLIKAGEF